MRDLSTQTQTLSQSRMVLVLCIGDLAVPHRAVELPPQFKALLVPGKIHTVLCTGNLVTRVSAVFLGVVFLCVGGACVFLCSGADGSLLRAPDLPRLSLFLFFSSRTQRNPWTTCAPSARTSAWCAATLTTRP